MHCEKKSEHTFAIDTPSKFSNASIHFQTECTGISEVRFLFLILSFQLPLFVRSQAQNGNRQYTGDVHRRSAYPFLGPLLFPPTVLNML